NGTSINVSSSTVNQKSNKIDEKAIKVKRSIIKQKNEDECHEFSGQCNCRNCRVLVNLTECALCMEILQSNQIKSCPVCANVVCIGCASRLTSCAFCRSEQPAERNRALERFVDRLFLPCKHSKSGCKVLLDGESRFIHESLCNFSALVCPVGRGDCDWHGTIANVQAHFRTVHMLQPLQDHGFSVQFNNFRSKAKDTDSSIYTVCLSCYEQLFVIRVVLCKSRLRLFFTRLGYEEVQPLTTRPQRYGVSVVIRAHAGRRMRGLVPFGKYDRESREITVSWDGLFPKSSAACAEDMVEIDLLVKQLEES
ncbi:PREDICTED: E3 ubiquitin-protein ligase SINAT3-like, partial [Ceratosolen solmsi marchali]|uniref:RING-type E3 ubiquitin transferase n=1 Tax=Ceratosolen solmsi marchali TaxID=326594 RepID=A0AAJ7DWT0_9HYME